MSNGINPKRLHNVAGKLFHDYPRIDDEKCADQDFRWRCDVWEMSQEWPLFATTWGKTRFEAQAKANTIVQQCGRPDWRSDE